MNWILDTNIVSETNKRRPNDEVMRWLAQVPQEHLFLTTLTMAELRNGIEAIAPTSLADQIRHWLDASVRIRFENRIIPIDEEIFARWRSISRAAQRARKPTSPVDLLIAAAALHHSCGVATRDVMPFIGTGVPVLNPFTGERFNGA